MRGSRIFVAVLLLAGGALFGVSRGPYYIWDGGFPRAVTISSRAAEIRAVHCQAALNQLDAQYCMDELLLLGPRRSSRSATSEPYDGKPVEVLIPVSGKTSWTGREVNRTQYGYIVVVAVMEDGHRVGKIIAIPDRCRDMTIALP